MSRAPVNIIGPGDARGCVDPVMDHTACIQLPFEYLATGIAHFKNSKRRQINVI